MKTPYYLFDGAEFQKRAAETASILGPDVKICYSIKANPYLLAMLPPEFSAVEVCSPGELQICMELAIDPKLIIYSGLNKGREDIKTAIEYGVSTITAESLLQLDMIDSCASAMSKTVKVLVRASASSQFGIDRHSLPQILAEHNKYPSLEFVGLHFFTGTQKHKSKEIIKEISFLEKYISELRETSGLELLHIEYGTGLPSYMFYDKELNSPDDAYASELELLAEIAEPLNQLAKSADLTVEMGRFFAASCGHYYTEVVDTKTNDGINYAIIDGGSHQIRYFGQMQGMQIPFMDLCKPDIAPISNIAVSQEDCKWTVCGSLCTTADVLARNVSFEGRDLNIGDVLVFHQAGAYSLYECMSLFLSRDMPIIYLKDINGTVTCARNRFETELFNRPEGLTRWQ